MKTLRRLALARIHADSTLRRQHWTASGGWRRRIAQILTSFFVMPVLLIMVLGLSFALGAILGTELFKAPDIRVYLFGAGIAAFAAFIHASWTLSELVRSRSLALISVVPDSDNRYLRGRLIRSLRWMLPLLAGIILLGAGFAFSKEFDTVITVQILFLSTLLWSMTTSLSIVLLAFLPFLVRSQVMTSISGTAFMLFVACATLDEFGIVQIENLILGVLIVLPTGWPLLIIKYGVIQDQPEVWWLLVPAGCCVLLAMAGYSRLLSRYRIQEFEYEPGSLATARFHTAICRESPERGTHTNSIEATSTSTFSWWHVRKPLNLWMEIPEEHEYEEELTREQAVARIHEAGLTKPFDWSSAGFIERAVAKLLRDEERLPAEILSGGSPSWSRGLAWSLGGATAAIVVIVAIAVSINPKIAMISGHIGFFGVFGILASNGFAVSWRSSNGEYCPALALLPLDSRQVERATMTVGAIRSLFVLPFVTTVILVVTWGHGGPLNPTEAILLGAKIALLFSAMHQWFLVFLLPYSYSKPIGRSIRDIVIGIVILGITGSGVVLLFVSGRSEIWSVIGAGMVFGSGWVVGQILHRVVLNLPIDFVSQAGTQRNTRQRSQKDQRTSQGPMFWPRPIETAELP